MWTLKHYKIQWYNFKSLQLDGKGLTTVTKIIPSMFLHAVADGNCIP